MDGRARLNGRDENRNDPSSGLRDVRRRRRADDRLSETRLTEKPPASLFAELKRRNVIRMAGVYLVGSWMIVQVAETVLPTFEVPNWVLRAIMIVVALGFVPTLVFSWVFELTSEGLKRDAHVDRSESIAPQTGRRLNGVLAVLLALALVYLALDNYVLAPTRDALRVAGSFQNANPKAAAKVDAAISPKSIAVLPFENLSADEENAFFADGIQDQILAGLAGIGDLKVISRISTRRYSSRPENIAEIATALGVAHILEGTVQKSGERVRVNVQLINAASDSHIWGETYDRMLDDVFAVESEVAQKIAEALHAALTGDERKAIASKPTDNPKAYAAYLDARAMISQSAFDRDNIERIIIKLENAVALDPDFALAWAQLAQQHVWMYWEGFDPSSARLAQAQQALQHATDIAPGLAQVELARGMLLYYGEHDFPAALSAVRKAQLGLPNDAWVWHAAALLERRLGQWEAALADFEHARNLNPNDVALLTNYAITKSAMRRFDEASEMADFGLALKPDSPSLISLKVFCLGSLGDWTSADAALEGIDPDSLEGIVSRARQALYRREFSAASGLLERALAEVGDRQAPSSFNGYIAAAIDYRLLLALGQMRSGDKQAARKNYQHVEQQVRTALAAKPGSATVQAALHAALGQALAGMGRADEANKEGQRAVDLIPTSVDAAEGPGWQENLARIRALNGDSTAASKLIENLLAVSYLHPLSPALLKVDPAWDGIRDDEVFQRLVAGDGKLNKAVAQ